MTIFKQTLSSEWRKQRWTFCAAILIILLVELIVDISWMSAKESRIDEQFIKLPMLLIWFIAGSVAGMATTRSNRPADSASQDVSVVVIFLKLSLGVMTAFISNVIFVFFFVFRNWKLDNNLPFLFLSFEFGNPVQLPAGLLLAFAGSALLSILSRRVLLSAILSLAATLVAFFSISIFWLSIDFYPWEKTYWIVGNKLAVALMILGAIIFILNCQRPFHGILRGILLVFLATVLATGCFVLAYWAGNRNMQPDFSAASPDGKSILAWASNDRSNWREIWILPVHPEQGRRVERRFATYAQFSPDGKWITYYSFQNRIGLRSNFVSWRACRIDGSGDRALVSDFAEWRPDGDYNCGTIFSPDSARAAMKCGLTLYFADLKAHSLRKSLLNPDLARGSSLIGFHSNGTEVLLSRNDGRLAACSQEGECRALAEHRSSFLLVLHEFPFEIYNPKAQFFLDQMGRNEHMDALDYSRKQQSFVYALSSDFNFEKDVTQIHTLAIESGVDHLIATIPGHASSLFFSPSGKSLAVGLMGVTSKVVILQTDKIVRTFAGWDRSGGWADESEAILIQNRGKERPLALARGDVATGAIRQFYP